MISFEPAHSKSAYDRAEITRVIAKIVFFITLMSAIPVPADEVRFDVRYLSETTRDNLFDESVWYHHRLLPWLNGEAAVRLSESLFSIRTLEYKAEVEWPILSFLSARVRLANVSYLPEGAGSTNFLFLLRSEVAPISWLTVHLALGWYERFFSITSVPLLLFTFSRDQPDHDIAVDIGMSFQVSETLAFGGSIATFEMLNTFNLNNPFALLTADYTPEGKPWKAFAYIRDRLLLGFGRRDELCFGVGYQLPL